MAYLEAGQVAQLLRPVHGSRVHKLDGMSHMEAYDIRAHLNRVFGYGRWSADVIEMTLMYEEKTTTKAGKPAYAVGYRAGLTLTVCGPDGEKLASYTEYAASGQIMPDFKRGDAHDFAMKTAESQALKRAAINLGDQFGLSLYNNGSLAPLVIKTLVMPEAAPAEEGVDDGAPEVVPQDVKPEDDTEPEPVDPPKTVTRQRKQAAPAPEPAPTPAAQRDYLAEIVEAGGDKDFLRVLWKAAKADGQPEEILNAIADAASVPA
jgi:hypothetical protein